MKGTEGKKEGNFLEILGNFGKFEKEFLRKFPENLFRKVFDIEKWSVWEILELILESFGNCNLVFGIFSPPWFLFGEKESVRESGKLIWMKILKIFIRRRKLEEKLFRNFGIKEKKRFGNICDWKLIWKF